MGGPVVIGHVHTDESADGHVRARDVDPDDHVALDPDEQEDPIADGEESRQQGPQPKVQKRYSFCTKAEPRHGYTSPLKATSLTIYDKAYNLL